MKMSWCYAVQCDFSFLMPKAKDIRLPFFCLTLLRKCIQSPHHVCIHTPQYIQTHTHMIHTQHTHTTHAYNTHTYTHTAHAHTIHNIHTQHEQYTNTSLRITVFNIWIQGGYESYFQRKLETKKCIKEYF